MSDVVLSNQTQRYRVLALEARLSAVQLAGHESALTKIADDWERLAEKAEAELKPESAITAHAIVAPSADTSKELVSARYAASMYT